MKNRRYKTVVAVLLALSATAGAVAAPIVIPIANPGFEDLLVAGDASDGDYDYATDPPGGYYYTWPLPNWGYYGQDYSGMFNPMAGMITGEAPEGQCVGFVEADTRADPGPLTGGLTQVLDTDLAANIVYTLTVKVGNPKYIDYAAKYPPGNTFPGYRVQLWAGGNLLGEDANTQTVPQDGWITSTVVYSSGASVTPGQKLEIRLVNMGISPGGSGRDGYVLYDDVTLTVPGDPTSPFVDAGVDMITWSGRAVQLDPNVVNNDVTPLTYLWSADPAAGVVFDPGADVEDPDVTITKPATVTTAVAIANPGFETPVLVDGDYTLDFTTCPGWSNVDVNTAGGVWNPGLPGTSFPGYGGNAPEGQNIAYVNKSGIKQVLTKTFVVDTTYTLTVKVGNTEGFDWTGYKVQLLAGGTVLAEDDNTVAIATGTFGTSTVTYTYDPGDSALLGQALQIRLFCLGSGGEADFDDVQLTAEGPAPDPYIVTLTLEANNVGAPPERARIDTMTIDVYDTACEAAKAAGLGTDNPGDFDGNCITDANDLDELAEKWLTNTGLTAPVLK